MPLQPIKDKHPLIGITERGDAGLDLSWQDALRSRRVDGAILITKHVTNAFCTALSDIYATFPGIILHVTCTGWGGTAVEPNVPDVSAQAEALRRLLAAGFPSDHIVLRLDPILPWEEGLRRAETVLSHPIFQDLAEDAPLRVRISLLDVYPHVRRRFADAGIPLPIAGFSAGPDSYPSIAALLARYSKYYYETCAEPAFAQFVQKQKPAVHLTASGCISETDLQRMGMPAVIGQTPTVRQRKTCLCLAGKTELLKNRVRCPHQCLYCYWKD